ncbi:hypothetical protein WJX74_009142 [Apatococcus lobatus]|uniref:PH domain-containing protein n=1 Tax=Apatococcus lobatus TaxID=904363 RepID=A0AAW1RHL8_9CHLO
MRQESPVSFAVSLLRDAATQAGQIRQELEDLKLKTSRRPASARLTRSKQSAHGKTASPLDAKTADGYASKLGHKRSLSPSRPDGHDAAPSQTGDAKIKSWTHKNIAGETRAPPRPDDGHSLLQSTGGYSQQSGDTTFRSASSTSPQRQPPSPAAARAASQALSDVSLTAYTIHPSSPVADALHATVSLSWPADSEDGKKKEGGSPRGHVRFGGSQTSEATSTASGTASAARHLQLTESWLANTVPAPQQQEAWASSSKQQGQRTGGLPSELGQPCISHQRSTSSTASHGFGWAGQSEALPDTLPPAEKPTGRNRLSRMQPDHGKIPLVALGQMPMAVPELGLFQAPSDEETMRLTLLDRLKKVDDAMDVIAARRQERLNAKGSKTPGLASTKQPFRALRSTRSVPASAATTPTRRRSRDPKGSAPAKVVGQAPARARTGGPDVWNKGLQSTRSGPQGLGSKSREGSLKPQVSKTGTQTMRSLSPLKPGPRSSRLPDDTHQAPEPVPTTKPLGNVSPTHMFPRPKGPTPDIARLQGSEPSGHQPKADSPAVPGAQPLTSHTSLAALLEVLNTHDTDPEPQAMGPRGRSKIGPGKLMPAKVQQNKLDAFVNTGSPLVRTPTELEMDLILHGSRVADSLQADGTHAMNQPDAQQPRANAAQSSPKSDRITVSGQEENHWPGPCKSPQPQPASGMDSSAPRRLTTNKAHVRDGSSIGSTSEAAIHMHAKPLHHQPGSLPDSSETEFQSNADSSDADSDSSGEYIEHKLDGASDARQIKPARWQRKQVDRLAIPPSSLLSEVSLRQRHSGSRRPSDDAAVAAASARSTQAASLCAPAASSGYQQSSYQQSLLSARSSISSIHDMKDGPPPAGPASPTTATTEPSMGKPPSYHHQVSAEYHSGKSANSPTAEHASLAANTTSLTPSLPIPSQAGPQMQLQATTTGPVVPSAEAGGLSLPEPRRRSSQPEQQHEHATDQQGRLLSPQVLLMTSSVSESLDGEQGMANADPAGGAHELLVPDGPTSRQLPSIKEQPLPGELPGAAPGHFGDAAALDLGSNAEPEKAQHNDPDLPSMPQAALTPNTHGWLEASDGANDHLSGEGLGLPHARQDPAHADVLHVHQQYPHLDPSGAAALPIDAVAARSHANNLNQGTSRAFNNHTASAAPVPTQAEQLHQHQDTAASPSFEEDATSAAAPFLSHIPLQAEPAVDSQPALSPDIPAVVQPPPQHSLHIHITPAQATTQHALAAKGHVSPSRLKHQTCADDVDEHPECLGSPPSPFGDNGGLAKPRDIGRAESAEPALLLGGPSDAESDDGGHSPGGGSQGAAFPAEAAGAAAQSTAVHPSPPSSFLPALTARDSTQQQAASKPGTVSSHPIGSVLVQAEVLVGQMRGAQLLAALATGTKMRKAWERGNSGSNRKVQALLQDRRLMIHYPSGWRRKAVSHFVNRIHVMRGVWRQGKAITADADTGSIKLEPGSAEEYTLWVLGLNAALLTCQDPSGTIATQQACEMQWSKGIFEML